ncbi:signal peptidase I [Enterococcus haemoperoxidus ATCC BAA-382]|uniref:Signal peptidase I n=1 Tax=Enterococcus haemoperoxidus ATCC BAA-382 TaxID=1158608 RepID=R2QFK4_9ENTE|nr:signal peptidase I [Enterococcus haemoperoxidus]EOH94013.1 signal peptidase I [Enterococcus haemoperoxidus ATCC BAA-382]EOT63321.1 signal peptidase I [Enterococcus haemoperoxidus ATCC BAA-382]OJG54011.1 signal peptidase I [Enterococcus haemoperoxidus]
MDEVKKRFERLKRQLNRKFNKNKKSKNRTKNREHSQAVVKKKRPQPRERVVPIKEDIQAKSRLKEEQARKNPPTNKKRKKKKLTKEEFEKRKKKKRKESIIEIVKFMLPVVFFAIFVFFFILNTSPHMVDGDSMKPTLLNKDRVIVRRTKEPKRYEVITFKPPVKSDFQYVKRIIGMPGDLVWTEGTDLFINHQAESLPKSSEFSAASELPDGTIKINVSEDCLNQMSQLKKIPKGHYFVLGDNRNNSSDSRAFGLVDGQAIEGVVSFRFAPFDNIGWIK